MNSDKQKTLGRVHEWNQFLLQNAGPIFRLRKIGHSQAGTRPAYAYAVSLAKDHRRTPEERVLRFAAACGEMLNETEWLITEDKSFRVVSEDFEVFYYVEAWRKCADRIAYLENGNPKVELLHRMSCEQAAHIFKTYNLEPFELINGSDMFQKSDNHADQYAAFAKLCLAEQIATKNPRA